LVTAIALKKTLVVSVPESGKSLTICGFI